MCACVWIQNVYQAGTKVQCGRTMPNPLGITSASVNGLPSVSDMSVAGGMAPTAFGAKYSARDSTYLCTVLWGVGMDACQL